MEADSTYIVTYTKNGRLITATFGTAQEAVQWAEALEDPTIEDLVLTENGKIISYM